MSLWCALYYLICCVHCLEQFAEAVFDTSENLKSMLIYVAFVSISGIYLKNGQK